MWLIITLQFLGSIFIEKFLGYILPKSRGRIIYRKKLKDIVHGFAPCIHNTSSPGNLERIMAETRDLIEEKVACQEVTDKHLLDFIDFQFKRISQLNKRTRFFRIRSIILTSIILQNFLMSLSEFYQILNGSSVTLYEHWNQI